MEKKAKLQVREATATSKEKERQNRIRFDCFII